MDLATHTPNYTHSHMRNRKQTKPDTITVCRANDDYNVTNMEKNKTWKPSKSIPSLAAELIKY